MRASRPATGLQRGCGPGRPVRCGRRVLRGLLPGGRPDPTAARRPGRAGHGLRVRRRRLRPAVHHRAGDRAAEGSYVTYPGANPQEVDPEFLEAYQSAFDAEPGAFTVEAYQNALLVIDAIKNVGCDREAITEYIRNFDGEIFGKQIAFDENGDIATQAYNVFVVEDGEWVVWRPRSRRRGAEGGEATEERRPRKPPSRSLLPQRRARGGPPAHPLAVAGATGRRWPVAAGGSTTICRPPRAVLRRGWLELPEAGLARLLDEHRGASPRASRWDCSPVRSTPSSPSATPWSTGFLSC